jgi:hypothetical protein
MKSSPLYSLFVVEKNCAKELNAYHFEVSRVVKSSEGLVGFSNLFENSSLSEDNKLSLIPTRKGICIDKSEQRALNDILSVRMLLTNGSLLVSKEKQNEVKELVSYFAANQLLPVDDPKVYPIENLLDYSRVAQDLAHLDYTRVHPYQHLSGLINLFKNQGIKTTAPEKGLQLYESLGNKAVFHRFLQKNGFSSFIPPTRFVIAKGSRRNVWGDVFLQCVHYSQLYDGKFLDKVTFENERGVWRQVVILQDAYGGGGIGTIRISFQKEKWLVQTSRMADIYLDVLDDLLDWISVIACEQELTVTPFLVTWEENGQEQSFSFCITIKRNKFVVAGPQFQRLLKTKAFNGFVYDGSSSFHLFVEAAKYLVVRMATYLITEGLQANYPLRAGWDFFVAVLPDGSLQLIAQDPNMRDTATATLPYVVLVAGHGEELQNGNIVLSQADHVELPFKEDWLNIAGVIRQLKQKEVPLFSNANITGVVLQSLPNLIINAMGEKCISILVGFVATTITKRNELEKMFENAFNSY